MSRLSASPLLRPFASRVLPYIHDDFLLTRRADLNRRARLYMAAPFKLALRHYPRFLANSGDTRRKLAAHCRSDAEVTLYRPPVRNVFGLQSKARAGRDAKPRPLRLVALGTVEPRKNFCAAATVVSALHARGFPDATLDIVGRQGWGGDWRMLQALPGVTLHGYQPGDRVSQLLDDADLFICTSHDEGLVCLCSRRNMPASRSLRPTLRSSARCSAIPASSSTQPNRLRPLHGLRLSCPAPDGARAMSRLRKQI